MPTPRESRFSTAVVLGTLALCAFFLAQGATQVLAAELLGSGVDEAGPKPRSRTAVANPEFLRRREAKTILERNIFDSSRGDLMLEPVSDEPVAMGPEGKWDPAQPAPECGAQLRLVGAVVNPTRPEWSFAAIAAEEGKTMLYRQGSNVDGSYVLAVRPSSVVMQPESGGACELMMFRESTEEPAPAPKPAQAARRPSRATNDRNAGLTTEQLEQGIQKVSDTQFNIQRSVIDTILANQGSIMKTARVIPHEENGRVVGMKLYGIRRDSLLGKLGIRNGDMLRTINGFDMTSPDSALQAYSRLRTASELSLAVKRQSKEMNIEYNIQ